MLQNLLLEKLLKEYDFLNSDLKYKKAVIDQYLPSLHKTEIKVEEIKDDIVENVKRVPSEIEKQIYRQISKLTHPDKNSVNVEQFTAASAAYSSGNFLQLMKIAQDLEIKLQIDAETISKIETEIQDLKMQNQMLEQHLIWKWYLTEEGEEKEALEQHIKSL